MKWKLGDELFHGGDYNPDQWLDCPEILEKDIEYMKEAKVNCVSLGIFAWSVLEPNEGDYQFDWLETIINKLYDNGIFTFLATPSGARPVWMAEKYPEVLRVAEDLHRNHFGQRHNHCYTSPVYREKVWQMNKRLAERFGDNPAVVLWHLSNEYGGQCFCPLCIAEFKNFLKKKYGTIENLNKQWWTGFWSHTYQNFEQIEPPMPKGENLVHGQSLDWMRFVTEQTVDFCKHEIAAIRAGGSNLPVTTNLMGYYRGLDYYKFRDILDINSYDSYPDWNNGNDLAVAIDAGFTYNIMRCVTKQSWLLMESTPSNVNWRRISPLKRPGVHKLSSINAVAHGANSVQYFQWRKSRGCSEKFHGAVIGHDGTNQTRVFKDVKDLGKTLQGISSVTETSVKPQVAVIYDWANRWALDMICGPRTGDMKYIETVKNHYAGFFTNGIMTDIIDSEDDFSDYSVIVAPVLYMYKSGVANKLKSFVENGGTLVATYFSGVSNENDLCYLGEIPHGMTDVFGLFSEEIDPLPDYKTNSFTYENKNYKLKHLCERVVVKNATVLSKYESDFYENEPVLTVNKFGKGEAYYLAANAEPDFYLDFYKKLAKNKGIEKAIETEFPKGVTAFVRKGENENIVFLQNFNSAETEIFLPVEYENLENQEIITGNVALKPFETLILKQATKTK